MNRNGRKPVRRPGRGANAKKAMAVLTALCMLFAMMPAYTAGAAEAKANTADYALYYSTGDGMLHRGKLDGDVVESTEGMAYEGKGNTLTLKGFHFETEVETANSAGLVMPADTTIVLQGENYIKQEYYDGIKGAGNLIIEGNGKLTAVGGESGISAPSGSSITINSGTIEALSARGMFSSVGIEAGTKFTINGGTVKAEGKKAETYSAGIYVLQDIEINGGTVEASSNPEPYYEEDELTPAAALFLSQSNIYGEVKIAQDLQILAGDDAGSAESKSQYNGEYYVKIAPPAPELPPEHKHCICGADEENHTGHGEQITYIPLDEDGFADGKLSGGNYYLTEDVTLKKDMAVEDEVNLCLNGHTVSCGEFQWKNSVGTLNICDCVGDEKNSGKIQGTHSPLVSAGGTVNLYGGSIEGTVNSAMGIDEHGEVNLYGGTVKGDAAGISPMQGKLNIYDGTIQGSETGAGSVQGTLTIRGGEISGISSVSGIVNAAGGMIKTAKAGGEDSFDIDLAAGGKLNLGGSPNLSSVRFDKTEQISASYDSAVYSGGLIALTPSADFEDTFTEDKGIAVSNVTKDINDSKFTLTSKKYTMEPESTDLVIKPITHTVTLKTDEGYTWKTGGSDTPETDKETAYPVRHGDSFSFTFVLRDGYHKTNDFAVKVNNNTIQPVTDPGNESGSEQHYIIENITEDETVTAEGIEKDPPVVPPTDPPGTTVPGSSSSSTGATTSGSSSSSTGTTTSGSSSSSTGTTTSGSSSSSTGTTNPSSSSSSAGTVNPSSSSSSAGTTNPSSSSGTTAPGSSSSSAETTSPGSSESSSSSQGAGETSTAAPGTADPTAPSNPPVPGGENGGSEPETGSNGGKDKEPAGKAEPGKDTAGGNTAGRDGEAAQTGDESDPELYFGLLILSLLGIAGAVGSRRKKKQ